ncbi:MAG: diguanylate cyclase, partial [Thermoleophilia bacterium]|nr:diguanylate cyclase [Thermoleophilia bacterium]
LSCGIAVFPQDGRNTHELFHVADANMYRAKNANVGHAVAAKA